MNPNLKKWYPVFIALAGAIIVTAYYVISGRSSYEHNVRQLQDQNDKVEKTVTDTTDSTTGSKNSLTIKCKNGETYEIVYKEGQTNFDGLVYDKCGEGGGESVNN